MTTLSKMARVTEILPDRVIVQCGDKNSNDYETLMGIVRPISVRVGEFGKLRFYSDRTLAYWYFESLETA